MELRYWLLIFCLLAIVVLFVDGYRRWKQRPRYTGAMTSDVEELPDFPLAELPQGGARVRPMTPQEISERNERLNLSEKVPMLMDSFPDEPIEEYGEEDEYGKALDDQDEEDSQQQEMPLEQNANEESETEFEPHTDDMFALEDEPKAELEEQNEFDGQNEVEEQYENSDYEGDEEFDNFPEEEHFNAGGDGADYYSESGDLLSDVDDVVDSGEAKNWADERIDVFAEQEPGLDHVEPEDVIVINVMASDDVGFDGEHLLQIVLACGMRFGSMDIFHRTDDDNRVQFSVANCKKPGTFDLSNMEQTQIPGISFFMTLPCSADALESFNYMYETANVVARHLHGQMKDEVHNVFTGQTVEHCRNRIREFARSQLIKS